MDWYQIKFKSESWHASAWQADTIWGHLCWGLRYTRGENTLRKFISAYERGAPPLLISNGFPEELLPRPIVVEPALDESLSLLQQRKEFRDRKMTRNIRFLSAEEFLSAIRGEQFIPSPKDGIETTILTLKNQINRITSTTGAKGAGQLYNFEQYKWTSISIYLKIEHEYVETTRELFENLARSGYGKRKSVGYGQVKLVDFEPFSGFSSPKGANGFVTLSNFVPGAQDPTHGYWDIIVKYGKLGEEYATGQNPFKKPLIMFTAGSCFYDSPCREFYGRLVHALSESEPQVMQYAYALPVPIKLPMNSAVNAITSEVLAENKQ